MRVTTLKDVQRRPRRVAIGSFDGVHLGHREVIAGCDTVLTFDPHPLAVTRPEAAPRLLTDRATRLGRLARLGVSDVVVIPFDAEFAARSPRDFIDDVLVRALSVVTVSVGANFRFGARGAGDCALLAEDARFATRVVRLRRHSAGVVSSTRIRQLVADGAVEEAAVLLGWPLTVAARVSHGGRLSFDPTVAVPGPGDYIASAGGLPASVRIDDRGARLRIEVPVAAPFRSGELEIEFVTGRRTVPLPEPAFA